MPHGFEFLYYFCCLAAGHIAQGMHDQSIPLVRKDFCPADEIIEVLEPQVRQVYFPVLQGDLLLEE